MTYIYALRDESGIRYVGKADDPAKRCRGHWSSRNRSMTIKNSWLKSLVTPPTVQILQEVEGHEWQAAETDWILQLKSIGRRLTNGTGGGEDPPVHRGEDNNMSTLTDEQVRTARQLSIDGELGTVLADRFGVTAAAMSMILTGATRLHAGGPIKDKRIKQRLSQGQVQEIRTLVAKGSSQVEVARSFGVHTSHVNKIVHGTRCNTLSLVKE